MALRIRPWADGATLPSAIRSEASAEAATNARSKTSRPPSSSSLPESVASSSGVSSFASASACSAADRCSTFGRLLHSAICARLSVPSATRRTSTGAAMPAVSTPSACACRCTISR